MATETLLPDGIGLQGLWINDWTNVDEGVDSHDSDITYMYATVTGATCRITFANTTLTGTFSRIRLRVVARITASSEEIVYQPYINGADVSPSKSQIVNNAYAIYQNDWNGSWTVADINTLQIKLTANFTLGHMRLTATEAIVDNVAASSADLELRHVSLDQPVSETRIVSY